MSADRALGFAAPVHRALTEPMLLAGAPRAVALVNGTLAAARAYGRQGISVAMADANRYGRASASRYVTSRLVSPPVSQPLALVDWLARWGQAHPGTLLYPSNDHLAWLFAAHREQLSASFVMYSPSEESVMTLLDKTRLRKACADADVAIETPVTFALDDIETFAAFTGDTFYAHMDEASAAVTIRPPSQCMALSKLNLVLVDGSAKKLAMHLLFIWRQWGVRSSAIPFTAQAGKPCFCMPGHCRFLCIPAARLSK